MGNESEEGSKRSDNNTVDKHTKIQMQVEIVR